MSSLDVSLDDLKARWRELFPGYQPDFQGDRGLVIEMMKLGMIERELANRLAQEQAWRPFEVNPDPVDLDPFARWEAVSWSMPMAVAWITWREPIMVARHDPRFIAAIRQWGPFEERENGTAGWGIPAAPPAMTLEQLIEASLWADEDEPPVQVPAAKAWEHLRAALSQGAVTAIGREEGKSVEIQPIEWRDLREVDGGFSPGDKVKYRDVDIERGQLLKHWPALAIPADAPSSLEKAVAAPTFQQTAGPRSLAARRLAARQWYSGERIPSWSGSPRGPKASDDFSELKVRFDIGRRDAQKIRNELAPARWKEPGSKEVGD